MSIPIKYWLHRTGEPEDRLEAFAMDEADTMAHVQMMSMTYAKRLFGEGYELKEKIPAPTDLNCLQVIDRSDGKHRYTMLTRRIPMEKLK